MLSIAAAPLAASMGRAFEGKVNVRVREIDEKPLMS